MCRSKCKCRNHMCNTGLRGQRGLLGELLFTLQDFIPFLFGTHALSSVDDQARSLNTNKGRNLLFLKHFYSAAVITERTRTFKSQEPRE